MAANDPWNVTDELSPALLDTMADRLEKRASDPRFQAMAEEYLGAMALTGEVSVLDIGCGTGIAARWIAAQPAFAGTVLGIDLSPHLIAIATGLAENEGLGSRSHFAVGDSIGLELSDASFDAVVAHTLLSHVDDPQAVLAEAMRLTRPGGLIGVFDGDYASQTFEEEDEEASKTNSELFISAFVTQPRVMRRMPRYATALGLDIVSVFPSVIADIGKAKYWAGATQAFRTLGPTSGLISTNAANAWADAQEQYSAQGVFFGASVFYAYVLKRPD